MLVADLPDQLEVALRRRDGAQGRSHHRFGYERRHILRTCRPDRRVKGPGAFQVALTAAPPVPAPIAVRRGNVREVQEEGDEPAATGDVPRHGESPQRVPVVALPPGDHLVPSRLTVLQVVLPGHLRRRLCGLGPAGAEEDTSQPRGREAGQLLGAVRHRFCVEVAAVDIGDLRDLFRDGLGYLLHAVADVDADGACAPVDISAPLGVIDVDTLRLHDLVEVF